MDTIRKRIYLAGMLHDIGKFYQRASGSFNADDNNLKKQSEKIADYICPKKENDRPTHQHVIWTNEFFEQMEKSLKLFSSVKDNDDHPFHVNAWATDAITDDNIANLASNHHRPATDLQKIITLADWWSAGIDRPDNYEEKDNIFKGGIRFHNYKSVPLFSIFNELNTGDQTKINSNTFVFKPRKLEVEDVFPIKYVQDDVHDLQKDYADLWKEFIKEFARLPLDSFRGFEESLSFLLRKYTWAIPSNTVDKANVSLFDHLKTTAAFADCLYVASQHEEYKEAFDLAGKYPILKQGYYPVMLLGVDISGIQSFIYDIASNKAAKSLKGRSFYLQLLADAILMKFYRHQAIEAMSAHVLYAAGGKFFMLLPNTPEVKEAIIEIKNEIDTELWEEHKGRLSVHMDVVPFAYHSQFINNKAESWISILNKSEKLQVGALWKALNEKLSAQKNRKFVNLIRDDYDAFFNPQDRRLKVSGKLGQCAVTGDEFQNEQEKVPLDKESEKYVSKSVYNQIKLGQDLKDVDYIIVFKENSDKDDYLKNRARASINILGTNFYLFDKNELIKELPGYTQISSADISTFYCINTTGFLDAEIKGKSITYGYKFYGGNEQAYFRDDDGTVIYSDKNHKKAKTFEDLAIDDKGDSTSLGVLRMDIDNLGTLFIKGLPEKSMSFSAYSTLSFNLELFFSGYLNTIRDENEFRDWVNILYSGGDDLFVIGRWDKVILFAEQVQKRFKQFTGRDDITISGGMVMVGRKFPIAKAADMAGDAEKAAKNYGEGKLKNAFCFLGQTISWKHEFGLVKILKDTLMSFMTGQGGIQPLSKALLHQIMRFKAMKDGNDLKYLWLSAYYFKRYRERYCKDNNADAERFINDITRKIVDGDPQSNIETGSRYLDLLALATRWCELELKLKTKA
ncbi:MAG: type III-A CRISPR-associated protein Cas10/Csm1 [Bacteroidia bacterium]|nr:type III-A CRISPR-associated protein Cas10/Csm1 [Bacteroidales bacterium]NCD40969.1 type III-A CRISPR-associated protein Cas10/Csm1 [Bacteroidia bacterium]